MNKGGPVSYPPPVSAVTVGAQQQGLGPPQGPPMPGAPGGPGIQAVLNPNAAAQLQQITVQSGHVPRQHQPYQGHQQPGPPPHSMYQPRGQAPHTQRPPLLSNRPPLVPQTSVGLSTQSLAGLNTTNMTHAHPNHGAHHGHIPHIAHMHPYGTIPTMQNPQTAMMNQHQMAHVVGVSCRSLV